MCVSPPCSHVHPTLAPPSATRRSSVRPQQGSSRTHTAPCVQLVVRQPCGIEPNDQRFVHTCCDLHCMVHKHQVPLIFPLFSEVHIGSIKALKESVSLSVLPSVSLCAIWPSLLPWIENIGAHLHYQQFICVSVCACVFRRQLKNSLEGCQMAGVCGDVWGAWGGGEMMGADEGKDRRKHKEAKTAAFSALQLLFSQIITLHPLTPKTKGTPPVWKHE